MCSHYKSLLGACSDEMAEDVRTSSSREARGTCTFRHQCFAHLQLQLGPSTRSSSMLCSFATTARPLNTFVIMQCFASLPLELGPSTRSSLVLCSFATRARPLNTFVKTTSVKLRQQGSFPVALTQSWECYGPHGKAGTTQPTFMHFTDTSLRVLLLLLDQHCRCRSSRDGSDCKRGLRTCCVWSQNEPP